MKDELPAPEFDAARYVRPTQKWICGNAAEGKVCRIGPDARGHCRADFECSPRRGIPSKDESPDRYYCTRQPEVCDAGPLPDGTCSCSIPKCQPTRSLRSQRILVTVFVVALTAGVLLLLLGGDARHSFVNPGALSIQHSGATFAQAREKLGLSGSQTQQECAACHKPAEAGFQRWAGAAFGANPGPFDFKRLASAGAPETSPIDAACMRCHDQYRFHQPNVDREISCSVCHQEHHGHKPMKAPDGRNCAACHANEAVMEAAFQFGKDMPPENFDYRPSLGRVQFKPPRPTRGYTKVFHSFADHPEFQVRTNGLKDPDTLKFNHQRHFAEDIPPLNGGAKLECASCHQPDAAGAYHLKISYQQHCQACHSLQFDLENPKLLIPHGSSEAVRSFLQSLPTQYADYGARVKGITAKGELEEFVRQSLGAIRGQILAGENPEDKVFFSAQGWGARMAEDRPGTQRPLFNGCVKCHEVKPAAYAAAPAITAPVIPDRWQIRASFNHVRHNQIDCAKCHEAARSRETSDIILPSKIVCAECHSPRGGVTHDCSLCHGYHTRTRTTPDSLEILRKAAAPPDN
jgi:hypothetical protein